MERESTPGQQAYASMLSCELTELVSASGLITPDVQVVFKDSLANEKIVYDQQKHICSNLLDGYISPNSDIN